MPAKTPSTFLVTATFLAGLGAGGATVAAMAKERPSHARPRRESVPVTLTQADSGTIRSRLAAAACSKLKLAAQDCGPTFVAETQRISWQRDPLGPWSVVNAPKEGGGTKRVSVKLELSQEVSDEIRGLVFAAGRAAAAVKFDSDPALFKVQHVAEVRVNWENAPLAAMTVFNPTGSWVFGEPEA